MKKYIYVNSTESFIRKSKYLWGEDLIDYSKVEYIDRDTLVILICKRCNTEYTQLSQNHWRAKGCPQCFKNDVSKHHKGKEISLKNKEIYRHKMLNRWKNKEYSECMRNMSKSYIVRNKKCKHCGTTKNLIPKRKIYTGTDKEELLYSNICYDCSNKMKLKNKCRHCGTTENLMVRCVRNQYLKNSKIIKQDICKDCYADVTRNRWKNGGSKSFNLGFTKSKPQIELYKIAKMFFPDARDDMDVETNVSRRYPDIVIPSLKLIIEYDGSYWHSEEDDAKRDKELNDVGYSIVHFVDKIPSMLEFFGCIRRSIILKESILRVN